MALDTVSFALLARSIFSLVIAPVLARIQFRRGIRAWHNPVMSITPRAYRVGLKCGPSTIAGNRGRRLAAFATLRLLMIPVGSMVRNSCALLTDRAPIGVRGTLRRLHTGPNLQCAPSRTPARVVHWHRSRKLKWSRVRWEAGDGRIPRIFNTEYFRRSQIPRTVACSPSSTDG